MTHPIRLRRLAAPLLLAFGSWLAAPAALAQCPATPSACTPGSAPASSFPFAMGILNVTLGSINNSTLGVADGFKDYACTLGTALTIGQNYPIQVRTGSGATENVRVWIDLNNDGQFNNTAQSSGGELVFSSSGLGLQTGTVRISAGATTGVALRMRVAADYTNAPIPTPCTAPQYSQTEDYRVTLQNNTTPPAASFTADQTTTCSGCVQFTDQSTGAPTSWLWNFGDGQTSTQQNPRHCYTSPGTFTVTLTAASTAGSNVSTRPNYITYNNQVPVAASCTPQTINYCCNYGITQVTLGALSNTSAGGTAGYQDFSCTGRVSLVEGSRTNLTLVTSSNRQDTRVWLDLNNDGQFSSNEMLLERLDQASPVTGALTIPGTAVRNTPLRLRIISDFVGSAFTACAGVQSGQAEDYTVTVLPNTQPPVAAFTSDYATTCTNPVQFTDQSTNAPTSWLWSFGDGQTSTQQNPSHTYTTSGVYNVSLQASNAFGNNTVTQNAYIAVAVPCLQYCASSGTNMNTWISGVQISGGTLNPAFTNISGADVGGYGNYTGRIIPLATSTTYTMSVATANNFTRSTTVWIDYNRNGVFENSEIVLNSSTNTTVTAPFTVPSAAGAVGFTRMRVLMRLNGNLAQACVQNQPNAETEDYSVNISLVTANAKARELPGLDVYPNPTPDGRLQLRLPATAASTYALTVENLLGAVVHQGTVRLGASTEAALDLNGLPQGVYVLRLRGEDGAQATRRIVRN